MTISLDRAFKLILLILAIVGLDALTKALVHEYIPLSMWSAPIYPYGGVPVFENFFGVDLCLAHVTNRGGPWGVVSSHHGSLVALRVFAIVCLLGHLIFFNEKKIRQIPLALVIGGAIGNVVDSFLYGHVIDMIHFVFWGHSFAVFNLADACISCAVGFLLAQACFEKWKSARPLQKQEEPYSFDSRSSYEP
jgi:signal peptidase II